MAKRALIIFLPLAALLGATTAGFYYEELKAERVGLEARESHFVGMQHKEISSGLASVVSDLMILSRLPEAQEMFEGGQAGSREDLSEEVLLFSKHKGLYDQIRFLDETGMEVVRANFNDGESSIVPDEQLQSKANRYYFQKTFRLDRGKVYVSPFDLNVERGKIEQPLKPIIRFGTPVFDSRARKRGVIIVNHLGAGLLSKIEREAARSPGQFMLLNSEGFYLKGPRPEDEWGFMYDDGGGRTFGNAFPEAWQRISRAESGRYYSANGLFTFASVYPLLEAQESSAGSREAFAPSLDRLKAKEYYWKVVSRVPPGVLNAASRKLLGKFLGLYAAMAVLLAIGSRYLARAGVRRKEAERELREHHDQLEGLVEERTAELEKTVEELEGEITERKRAEEELRLLQTMTLAASEAEDFHSALAVALGKVCEATGWIFGEAWTPSPDGTVLECSPAWYASVDGLEDFRSESEGVTFPPGVGLTGRAWSSGRPAWMRDVSADEEFVRVARAR
ncbi:MAG: hypothetical protein RX318_11775, partial [bacterium]|nr:hypothetical protein [bacterium]